MDAGTRSDAPVAEGSGGDPSPGFADLSRPDAYGHAFAEVYDQWYEGVTDAEATARFVADRCGAGPVVELGVGSGRLAAPLTRRGVEVIGIDASGPMLSLCPDGAATHLIQADMARLPLRPGLGAGAVLIAFNTLFNVATEEGQVQVLTEAANLVRRGGVVIIEAIDADVLASAPERSTGVSRRSKDRLVVSTTVTDRQRQLIEGWHVDLGDEGVTLRPWRLAWCTATQLDERAAACGLTLAERHTGWGPASDGGDRSRPSLGQVSVYRR